jgi:RNA polymerase sigma-70 factor (sigma-E family)
MSPRDTPNAEFDEFVTGAWRRLQWTAYLLTGDQYLAEDLVQTALVKVYARWAKVRRDDAYAYTRRVLVNVNIDRLRRTHLREVPGTTIDRVEALDRPVDAVEQRDAITRTLAHLTARERRVVVLRYYCDLSEAAVAEELSVSVGTVKSTTSRAIAKLRLVDESMRGVG